MSGENHGYTGSGAARVLFLEMETYPVSVEDGLVVLHA